MKGSLFKLLVMVLFYLFFNIFSVYAAPEKTGSLSQDTPGQSNASPWQIRGRSETIAEWKDVSNSGSSSLDEGATWREELSVGISRQIKEGSMGLNLRGRATNDEQVDSKDARLLYLNSYFKKKNAGIEMGDVAASFNSMVLSVSVKGTKMNFKKGTTIKGFETKFLTGIQKASWDEIFGQDDKDKFDRYIAGIHTEGRFGTGKKLSFSVSAMEDKKNSGAENEPADISSLPARSFTSGIAWDWRFNRYLKTRGETAFTNSDDNTGDSKSAENAAALRIRLFTKPLKKSIKSNFLYERIDPDFKPLVASAASDRERFENDTTFMPGPRLKCRLSLKESRDNLESDLEETRTTDDGVLMLTFRPASIKRAEFNLRNQLKKNKGRGADQLLSISEASFNLRAKSGWKYGLGLIASRIKDDSKNGEDQDIQTLRANLGWKKKLDKNRLFRASIRLDGNFIHRDSGSQETLGGKIDLGYDGGKYWAADLSAATKNTYRDKADDNQYTAYELRGNYHPFGDKSKAVRLSASRRETDSDSETTSREHIARLSYLFSF